MELLVDGESTSDSYKMFISYRLFLSCICTLNHNIADSSKGSCCDKDWAIYKVIINLLGKRRKPQLQLHCRRNMAGLSRT